MVDFVLQIRVFTRGDRSIVPVPHVGHGVSAPTESNVGGWGGVGSSLSVVWLDEAGYGDSSEGLTLV